MEISIPRDIAGDREFQRFAEGLELSPRPPDQDAALRCLLREVPRLIGFARKPCFCEGKPTAAELRAQAIARELRLALECSDMGPDGLDREIISLIEHPATNAEIRELDALAHAKRVENNAGKRTIGPSPIALHLDEYAGYTTYTDETA